MPSLTIGDVTARLPIVQGGMAVRLSQAPLAAAVARAGGIGVIAGSGMTVDELVSQIREVRAQTDGVLGVNIMVAIRDFATLVQAALREGIDLLIAGAGFSRDVFAWCRDAAVEMVPVVGSARVAALSQRFGASAVVLEGVEAGGHLGTDREVRELLPEVLDAVDIPVIAAGGIVDGADIFEMFERGASGVQMGSRFLATVESSAPDAFKRMYVDATEEDIVTVRSPVGLLGRAIRNPFTQAVESGDAPEIESCQSCLKKCGKDYCIVDALVRAQEGDVETGLVFAGTSAARIHDVPTVAAVMERLEEQYEQAAQEVA
jgi:NAD(P)H-dependent flavin oxidoreductase YrpB (nitropropane dioxygenase family)